jgi:hypothetical protein
MRAASLVVLLAVVPACSGSPAGGTSLLTCSEAGLEASLEIGRRWSDPGVCTADAQCVAIPETVECPAERTQLDQCLRVLFEGSRDAHAAMLDEVEEVVCPRTSDCRGSASCAPVAPRCVGFTCEGIPTMDGCLEDCEALGCADCAERCLVAPSCVGGAGSCDAVVACGGGPFGRLVSAARYDSARRCLESARVVGVLDEPLGSGSGDVVCGIGPDGEAYVFGSGSLRTALGWSACDDMVASAALSAPSCGA